MIINSFSTNQRDWISDTRNSPHQERKASAAWAEGGLQASGPAPTM